MSYLRLVSNGSTAGGNGAPSAVTDGLGLRRGSNPGRPNEGFPDDLDEASILVEGTASGAGTIEYVRLWGWNDAAVGDNKWFPLGSGDDADKGKLNADATSAYLFGETGTDIIRHTERVRGLAEYSRLYAEYGDLTNMTRVDITLVSTGKAVL